MNNTDWKCQNFKGTKWQNINKYVDKEYLKNTYRDLLTRARQGMVIFIPESSDIDHKVTCLELTYFLAPEVVCGLGVELVSLADV